MTQYIQGYKGPGRIARYIKIMTEESRTNILPEAIKYCEEVKNIGAFAKIKEIYSQVQPLDEPQWKKECASELFEITRDYENEFSKQYEEEEKCKTMFKLAQINEERGEYTKAIKNVLTGIEKLKPTSTLLADGYCKLIRLNIFIESFNKVDDFFKKLCDLPIPSRARYNKFIQFIQFLLAIRSERTFNRAIEYLENVITFEDEDKWQFGEFLSFRDIGLFGVLIGLLTKNHDENLKLLVNNSKFRNHCDTIPELVQLLDDYKKNNFAKIKNDLMCLQSYFRYNIYFGKSLPSVINEVTEKCYVEYIIAYSVVDMKEMATMFGTSLDSIQNTLERFISEGKIKAKIDATTHTFTFIEGDERLHAYEKALKAVNKAVEVSQEIVIRSDVMFDYIQAKSKK